MEVIFSLQEINEAALKVVEQLGNNKVIALHGDMGAGGSGIVIVKY
jgi:tRNA A37 threonylcarbamoyladenosine biosynthesis protein TsaE